ncbi:TMV resistance protein N-like [Rhodamnia argentea]|uniref:TMV resistance protein N-like n=1 Tax=Rhodamnia argentea TaxID=178133 RepID=A0ABM3H3R7_9MYRT|nr:TMV resistance protein N-like [Rhodamnia argentea]
MSSSSSSSSSYSSHQWKHDVFMSFRGKDLWNNFISHLFRGPDQAGIDYFNDGDREDTGKEISHKLLTAIRHSRFTLILFSANYVDSKWCPNEPVEILECRRQLKSHGHMVVPIFMGVHTADVSNLFPSHRMFIIVMELMPFPLYRNVHGVVQKAKDSDQGLPQSLDVYGLKYLPEKLPDIAAEEVARCKRRGS